MTKIAHLLVYGCLFAYLIVQIGTYPISNAANLKDHGLAWVAITVIAWACWLAVLVFMFQPLLNS